MFVLNRWLLNLRIKDVFVVAVVALLLNVVFSLAESTSVAFMLS